ncbi:hypothetical protein L226DRAFT_567227 [Lentinus tigrinus ALCF2SS1-7]|uniref:uncharacterized protein n=1 Tax=Lentinus tigrinus ALCF2SS1-7 TaxID=1328758 RepID=UPI001166242B|nr:hypothetical protein L226DRAFT_567227 [Lentinus tigrinus ALCF2SS1-7]
MTSHTPSNTLHARNLRQVYGESQDMALETATTASVQAHSGAATVTPMDEVYGTDHPSKSSARQLFLPQPVRVHAIPSFLRAMEDMFSQLSIEVDPESKPLVSSCDDTYGISSSHSSPPSGMVPLLHPAIFTPSFTPTYPQYSNDVTAPALNSTLGGATSTNAVSTTVSILADPMEAFLPTSDQHVQYHTVGMDALGNYPLCGYSTLHNAQDDTYTTTTGNPKKLVQVDNAPIETTARSWDMTNVSREPRCQGTIQVEKPLRNDAEVAPFHSLTGAEDRKNTLRRSERLRSRAERAPEVLPGKVNASKVYMKVRVYEQPLIPLAPLKSKVGSLDALRFES